MNPTAEQSAILDAVATTSDNLMIRARAGCGKTSTLELISHATRADVRASMLLCFNKAIAIEAEKRMVSTCRVKTFNGLGHGIWSEYVGRRLTVEPKKTLLIYRELTSDLRGDERQEIWEMYDQVSQGVGLAKALGYIPESHHKAEKSLCTREDFENSLEEIPSAEILGLIHRVLEISIKQAQEGVIDFDDQVYMPAVFGGFFPSFPLVMIDEYQDLSPTNRAIVEKLCKRSRQIGVGDEAQAIYGFRGADEHSMNKAIAQFSMTVLPLTLTFRCPSKIVENVHWRVPDFRAFREGGTITKRNDCEIPDDAAVICRNNAPLLRKAMAMLKEGFSVDVAGVNIAQRILKAMEKLGDEDMTQSQTLYAIDQWLADKLANESKTAADLADCMRVFAKNAKTLNGAIQYAKHLFAQSQGRVRFMTGHKAKGLEFDHVYHLDSDLLRHHGQDTNIHYVIDSRPKESLTYVYSSMEQN